MARSRNIKPGFFKNEKLAELPHAVRLLFAGLWTLADREGRMEYRPRRIKAEIFPYEDHAVTESLSLLHENGFINIYSVGPDQFIEIPYFVKHQHPHHKEKESVIPKPQSCPGQAPDKPRSSPSDSLNLIPDSLNPQTRPLGSRGGTAFDEQYLRFQSECRDFGMNVIDEDFSGLAWREWSSLDGLQREEAITGIVMRRQANVDPSMVKRPLNYLKGREWKRPLLKPKTKIERMMEAI